MQFVQIIGQVPLSGNERNRVSSKDDLEFIHLSHCLEVAQHTLQPCRMHRHLRFINENHTTGFGLEYKMIEQYQQMLLTLFSSFKTIPLGDRIIFL